MKEVSLDVKLVIIGDGGVGKTAILTRFVENRFDTNYQPTIFENYTKELEFHNKKVQLSLWDTAGQEGYESLRTVSYNADVYLLCFASDSQKSLENVDQVWTKELNRFDPKKPKVLVGTKADMKASAETIVPKDEVEKVFKEIKAVSVVECSSKTGENIRQVFEAAIVAVHGKKLGLKKNENCNIV